MTIIDTLGRAPAGLALACALSLAGCASRADERCARWHLVIEPKLTVSMGPAGDATPVASLTVRPECTRKATS